MRGKEKNRILGLRARHALSDREGKFYERLREFPGVLFDANGYIIFATEVAYLRCRAIQFGDVKVHVPDGISHIAGYQGFTPQEIETLNARL